MSVRYTANVNYFQLNLFPTFIILLFSLQLCFNEGSFLFANAAYERADPNENGPILNDIALQIEKVGEDLHNPTSMAFIGHDDILVLEQHEGTVRRITGGELMEEPLLEVNVARGVEWGMLGIATSAVQTNENNFQYVYLYYTEPGTNNQYLNSYGNQIGSATIDTNAVNSVYRYELVDGELVNPKLLLQLPAYSPNTLHKNNHVGGKLLIGPDNNLYISMGDVGGRSGQAQNDKEGLPLDGTSGILRINQEGEVLSSGSDFGDGTSGLEDIYYAYGIRNSFGFDFDPVTGELWDTENGASENDELNMVEEGFNSGWGQVQGFADEDFEVEEDLVQFPNSFYSDPEFVWEQTIGVTSLKFLSSSKLGVDYQNTMFVGDVNTGNLYNFKLNPNRDGLLLQGDLADRIVDNHNKNVNSPQYGSRYGAISSSYNDDQSSIIAGTGFGVITDIKEGPDGLLYVLSLSGDIYKIYQ